MVKLFNAAVLAALLLLCIQAVGQDETCAEVHTISAAVRTKSIGEFQRIKLPTSYRAVLLGSFHAFELRPNTDNARIALGALPKTREDHRIWMTFGDSLCDGESVKEMKELGAFGDRLARLAAQAASIAPAGMVNYVSFANTAVQDPHSDYAVQMTSVCKQNRQRFQAAVDQLDGKQRAWFATRVFDPATCRALSLPEADGR